MKESGKLSGWHYLERRPVSVQWENGIVTRIGPADPSPPEDVWLAPALFDVQVNGYAGTDFQRDDVTPDQLLKAVRGLRAAGCSRFLLTLITDRWENLTSRFRRLAAMRSGHPELAAAIAGWHIEGPFLSIEPGFCGTHDPALMLNPTPKHIAELIEIASREPLLMTLAPERPCALACIEFATANGVRVSLGHTNASARALAEAVDAGARGFTHLANGCAAELNRHDNILWRVLDQPGLFTTLIPDGIHVTPALFRLLNRALDPTRIGYTTDCIAAAGGPPGHYTLGQLKLHVGEDGIVRQPGSPYLSGSALRPCDGVFRAASMLGCDWQECWRRMSSAPAAFAGLSPTLAEGHPAHFCLVRIPSTGGQPRISNCAGYELLDEPQPLSHAANDGAA